MLSSVLMPCVGALLLGCRPAAIGWLVVAVVVDALYRFSRRSVPHILNKQIKDLPPLTDLDATAPIIRVAGMFVCGASPPHGVPAAIAGVLSFVIFAWLLWGSANAQARYALSTGARPGIRHLSVG